MADSQKDGAAAEPQAADAPRQLILNAQYIKDLSFENPRAPQSLTQQTQTPAVDINVDVKATSLGGENYEVVLRINASAKVEAGPLFVLELVYGTVATVRNVPQPALASIILVEVPRLMFPFARNIIADATRDGGFPPLMINPIDFMELLRREQGTAAAAAPPPPRRRPASP
jgi:preprotein translocase subunit SecB